MRATGLLVRGRRYLIAIVARTRARISISPAATGVEASAFAAIEYCLTIGAFGDGDLARLTPASSEVCAQVTEIAAPGASLGTGGTAGTGGGCSAVPGAAPGYAPASFALLLVLAARRRRRNG